MYRPTHTCACGIGAFIVAVMFGLLLAGPAAAQDLRPARSHPAASIDIGALTARSDFTVFMRQDVPEEVRRVALRRLWTLIDLPPSCMELCHHAEPAAPAPPVRLAREQRADRRTATGAFKAPPIEEMQDASLSKNDVMAERRGPSGEE
jgi:Protein of unknown function (DUF3306)